LITALKLNASGLAAVWARENTPEALWDAFARREVYATSGTRIRVRVFGGFDFNKDDLYRSDFAANGYNKGVPMGGDPSRASKSLSPSFLVRALRDPDGANLDRLQIVKGWLDANGEAHERIYDIAVSGDRTIGGNGRCKTRLATPSTSTRPPTPTLSALRRSAATGGTPTLTRPSVPSTTSGSSRSRRRNS
jgi:hypothetical protein